MGDWEEIGSQVQFSRDYTENDASGAVFYSAAYITGKKKSGLGEWLKSNKFQYPALTPAIDWKKADMADTEVSVISKRQTLLSWKGVEGMRYSVYAIPEGVNVTGDNIPAEYLLGVSYTTTYTMPADKKSGYQYAVCVLDRYGNEYPPVLYGASGVVSMQESDNVTAEYVGGEFKFNVVVGHVDVYNEAGVCVASADNCKTVQLAVPKGVYVVKIAHAEAVSAIKVLVR